MTREMIARYDDSPCFMTEYRRKSYSDDECVEGLKGDKERLIRRLLKNEKLVSQMIDFFMRNGVEIIAQMDGKNDILYEYSKGLAELESKWIDWLDGDLKKPFRYMELFKLCLYNLQKDVEYNENTAEL